MPKWLKQMLAPTLMLWLCVIAFGIASAIGPGGAGMSKRAELVFSVAFPFIVASWVLADSRKRSRPLCYDYDSFAYFAWPVVVPIYLFQTRGVRALLTLLCFAGIWLIAALAAGVVTLVQRFVS